MIIQRIIIKLLSYSEKSLSRTISIDMALTQSAPPIKSGIFLRILRHPNPDFAPLEAPRPRILRRQRG